MPTRRRKKNAQIFRNVYVVVRQTIYLPLQLIDEMQENAQPILHALAPKATVPFHGG